jgi:TctA family transporter
MQNGFHPAPILLGFVLGPRFEENFRRAMLISRGDIFVFVEHPISAIFVGLSALLILLQVFLWLRRTRVGTLLRLPRMAATPSEAES